MYLTEYEAWKLTMFLAIAHECNGSHHFCYKIPPGHAGAGPLQLYCKQCHAILPEEAIEKFKKVCTMMGDSYIKSFKLNCI